MTTRLHYLLFLIPCIAIHAGATLAHEDISPAQAHDMIEAGSVVVLDVREYSEFCGSARHIEDAANLPLNSGVLAARFAELPTDVDIIVVCASGGRSNVAANFLDTQGFTRIHDMLGGMAAWSYAREPCGAPPVLEVHKDATGAEIGWTPTTGVQDYDLLRGWVGDLADAGTFVDLGPTVCLANDSVFTYQGDPGPLVGGTAHFYLVRQASGSWGQSSNGQARESASSSCD